MLDFGIGWIKGSVLLVADFFPGIVNAFDDQLIFDLPNAIGMKRHASCRLMPGLQPLGRRGNFAVQRCFAVQTVDSQPSGDDRGIVSDSLFDIVNDVDIRTALCCNRQLNGDSRTLPTIIPDGPENPG